MGAKRGKVDPEVEEAIRRIEEASRRKKTDLPSADKLETPAEQEERKETENGSQGVQGESRPPLVLERQQIKQKRLTLWEFSRKEE